MLFVVSIICGLGMPAAAFAQELVAPITSPGAGVMVPDATAIIVPYGNWLDTILGHALSIVLAAVTVLVTYASRKLPDWLARIVKTLLTEQILARAIDFGINATRGAVKGRVLEVNVGSAVLVQSIGFALDRAPAWFIKWTGGVDAIKAMIIARLPLAGDADLVALDAPRLPATPDTKIG